MTMVMIIISKSNEDNNYYEPSVVVLVLKSSRGRLFFLRNYAVLRMATMHYNNKTNNNNTNNTTFTLADCTDAIVTSTTCSSFKRFTYDEVSGKCTCCDVGAELIPWDYSSAIYVYSSSNPLKVYGAPQYCISGSTLYYPQQRSSSTTTTSTATAAAAVSGGDDDDLCTEAQYSCTCGDCTECGDPTVSYVDWNGPFVVPEELGTSLTAGVSTVSDKPLYDPVDTCTCNMGGPQCAAQYQEEQEPPPPPPTSGGGVSVYTTTVVSTTTVGLMLMMMMMSTSLYASLLVLPFLVAA
mmetsp:Transcript_2573/g.2851  ORF Transcript_2573/g.2851 Transcript_2573/m.2851 type:complete len:295 (+) Transcript_2573:79-963(+)